jgi:acetyltransferase-like isoleucine patch superfamily enzyme
MGENCFWQPLIIPSFPHLISFGDNVTVAGGVIFYEHDPIDRMWRCNKAYRGPNIPTYLGKVVVDDNVVIGGKSIILYDVHIGNDCVIGAGAVVTKDVPSFSIVAGNPARIIGDTRDLLRKRLSSIGIEFNENEFKYENYFN